MQDVEQRYGPTKEVFEIERSRRLSDTRWAELPLSLLPSPIFSTFTLSVHKNLEQFSNCSNGVTVMKKASRLYYLPKNLFFLDGPCGSLHNTCSSLGSASWRLKNALDENDPVHAEVLTNIKRRFRSEMFMRESIERIIHNHLELSRLLYVNFAMIHCPTSDHVTELMLTLSYQRLQTIQPLSDEELYDKIRRTFPPFETNFYQFTKVALSFRLDPWLLPKAELESSDLFEDSQSSRNRVMRGPIPKMLVEEIRLETLLRWLPEAYQRALFSS
ncbi:hypothetical protein BT96DRAFT_1001090 [Gymnopus androsaceus JB14]|uniref:Uncharacterized protein n=1 Tax=Gymnopus androsaceus JB14 TaxID=1447944 RepID=A0A6A4H1S3_9AGAR|nr:hypothetical protein BT96DRAFT_1001090 [Gymnopus androsaceus JB14]